MKPTPPTPLQSGQPAPRSLGTLLAQVSTPPATLLARDPTAPTRTQHLTLRDAGSHRFTVTERVIEDQDVIVDSHWVVNRCDIERLLGTTPLPRALYHLAALDTPCCRDFDSSLTISAAAIRCATWSELMHEQPRSGLVVGDEGRWEVYASDWHALFGNLLPNVFADTQAVRRQFTSGTWPEPEVPWSIQRACLTGWRVWQQREALELIERMNADQ
ncbi:hypothetical protein [Deinococcus sp. AJ005]|uniref:hypothetical protein n=1 Tax=Deinococcus sp. AJ005 TaxID=2652443 RepID=UPI00125CBA99|nr:hypothetical protein [Deinococcus sp. AJ005]QFP75020.1 hypothetical protein DAAJ005_00190 [Deinococcus sp. AJ005]